MQSKKSFFSEGIASFDIAILLLLSSLLLLLFISSFSSFHKTFAASPAFEVQEIRNQRNHWIQTYGNDSTHLKSDYANLLTVDYLSDGKTLDATFWLASNSENASTYNQSFKKISYGMLIDNYDSYISYISGRIWRLSVFPYIPGYDKLHMTETLLSL